MNVEGRLSIRAIARVRANNLVDVDFLVHTLVEGGKILLVEGSIVLEFSDANGALSVDPELVRDTVHSSQNAGVDVAKRVLLNRSLVNRLVVSVERRGLNQLSQTEEHIDNFEVLRNLNSTEDTRVDLACKKFVSLSVSRKQEKKLTGGNVLVVVELSLEQVLDDSDGSNDLDEVAARSVDLLDTSSLQPSNNGANFVL